MESNKDGAAGNPVVLHPGEVRGRLEARSAVVGDGTGVPSRSRQNPGWSAEKRSMCPGKQLGQQGPKAQAPERQIRIAGWEHHAHSGSAWVRPGRAWRRERSWRGLGYEAAAEERGISDPSPGWFRGDWAVHVKPGGRLRLAGAVALSGWGVRLAEIMGAVLLESKVVQTGVLVETRRGDPRAKMAGEVRLTPNWSYHSSSWL